MARPLRIRVPGVTYHVTQRGNDGAVTFFEPGDFENYLRLLEIAARRYETQIHAYVLMSNHVHLLLTPQHADGLSRTLQYVAAVYSGHVNQRLGRTGTLWGPRFRSAPVATDEYSLACHRYIELNPVRAGLAANPGSYPWSSFHTNALGEASSLLIPHATYLALGTSMDARRAAYRRLFDETLPASVVNDIRLAIRRGRHPGQKVPDSSNRTQQPEGSDPLL